MTRINGTMEYLFAGYISSRSMTPGVVDENEAQGLISEAERENQSGGCCFGGTKGTNSLDALLADYPDNFTPAATQSIAQWIVSERPVYVISPPTIPWYRRSPRTWFGGGNYGHHRSDRERNDRSDHRGSRPGHSGGGRSTTPRHETTPRLTIGNGRRS